MKTLVENNFFKVLTSEETGDVIISKRETGTTDCPHYGVECDVEDKDNYLIEVSFITSGCLATFSLEYSDEETRDKNYETSEKHMLETVKKWKLNE